MLVTIYIQVMIMMLMMVFMLIINSVSMKSLKDREKSSPFECGFDPKSSPRSSFSLHFFLIAMVFLIFDIEIALILPIVVSLKSSNIYLYMTISTSSILILILGLLHEWNQGALEWQN